MSKYSEKNLHEYIYMLEELIKNIIENTELKNMEINKRIDKLKNILSKNGITPEEIDQVLSINESYDKNLELLKNDVINENVPLDINSVEMFQQPNFKENIIEYINHNHSKFGINLNEE